MSFEKLRVYRAAEQLSAEADRLIALADSRFSDHLDQLDRAASSVEYNIGEAYGLETPGNKAHHLRIARGSADETRGVIRKLTRQGAFKPAQSSRASILARTVAKMLTALIRTIEEQAAQEKNKEA